MALAIDMTEGKEAGHILRFTLPLLVGNLLQQTYNIADTMIVGRYLGDNALAAVGATSSITYLFYTLCLGLAIGAGIIIAQFFGAHKTDKVKAAVFNSAVVATVFGIVISVVSVLLTRNVLVFLKIPDGLIDMSVAYMRIACGGTLAVVAYNWINAVMRSMGDSKTPLIFLGVASILNVVLDLLFVVVFHWGVQGAAAATVIAQGVSAATSILYAFSKNKNIQLHRENLRLDRNIIVRCIKTGLPIAAQNGLISISMVAIQSVTNTFGQNVMAAYTVSMRIEQFVQQPFASLNAAASTFTGQNTGAGKRERMIKGLHVALKISTIFAVIVMVLFFVFGEALVGCFVKNEKVIYIGARALWMTSTCYVFLGMIHTIRGFLNGAGDTGYALANGLAEVICRVGLSYTITKIAVIGYWGIWITTCITWFVTAMVSLIRYLQGKWKDKSFVK